MKPQGSSEDVSPIDFGVDLFDLQPCSLLNLITKMMPFQRMMFGAWTAFVKGRLKPDCVMALDHCCVCARLVDGMKNVVQMCV